MKFKIYYVIVFSALLIVAFQNCSNKLSFGISQLVFSSEYMGNYYTNNNYMDVELSSENMDLFSEIRYSVGKELDAQEWQVFSQVGVNRVSNQKINFRAMLGEAYSSDGSLDGEKVIYVGLRGYDRVDREKIYQAEFIFKMFLDTQAPRIATSSILQEGIKGKIYKLNQDVDLNLIVTDPNFEEQKASLFGLESLRWAVTRNGDCSDEFLSNKSNWMEVKDKFTVQWPEADPMKAFYFCIFAKDKAGNLSSFMSPAMTSLWSTIAGDNSVGNGSGVNSPNVRFKLPNSLFIDTDKNLHFFDDGFGVRRMIMNAEVDPGRTIQNSNYPFKNAGIVVFDSVGNSFSKNGSFIVMNRKNETTFKNIIQVTSMIEIKLATRKYQGRESLLISLFQSYKANDLTATAYLFEITLDKIQSLYDTNKTLTVTDLVSNYVLIGNGLIPNTTCLGKPTPCATIEYDLAENKNIILSSSDSKSEINKNDLKYSLGVISGITTDGEGNIYLSTSSDGTGLNVGQHTVRKLQALDVGKFQQTILTKNVNWISGINYFKKIKSPTESEELLFISSVTSPTRVFNLSANPITMSSVFQVNGLFVSDYNRGILIPTKDNSDFEYYIAGSSSSKIYRFNSSGLLLETLGRDTSNNSTTDPLSSVMGQPDGLVVDRLTNRIWITDSQFNMIYLLENNQLKKVSLGSPESNDRYTNGYRTKITYNSQNNELYWAQISGQIFKVKLQDYSQNLLFQNFTAIGQLPVYNWLVSGIQFDTDSQSLMINRIYPIKSSNPSYDNFLGLIEKANLADITNYNSHSVYQGNLLNGGEKLNMNKLDLIHTPTNIAMNSDPNFQFDRGYDGLVYTSNDYLKISNGVDKLRMINVKMSGAIKVIQADEIGSNIRYIIGATTSGSLQVVKIDVSDLFDITKNTNPIISNKLLCLAGTLVRNVGTIDLDKDGQLVFTDSGNARILKYLIRNTEGKLVIDTISKTTCP